MRRRRPRVSLNVPGELGAVHCEDGAGTVHAPEYVGALVRVPEITPRDRASTKWVAEASPN